MLAPDPAGGLLYLDPGTGSFLLQILIAAGMSVARPYVTVLTAVGDAPGLMALARALRPR